MNDEELMNMTIVIPTKNRPHYVKRILGYYLSLNFNGNVAIIDSSDKEIAEDIKNYINNINKVNFTYRHALGLPITVTKDNLDIIKTKYVSFLGDDDYIIPTGILKSIEYLENHSDISGCRGEGIRISETNISSNSILKYKNFFNRIEETSSERTIKHFSDYHTPFFHVCRSEVFIRAFSNGPSFAQMKQGYDRLIGDELLVAGLLLAFGKFVSIEGLHLVRTNSVESIELRDSWYHDEDIKGREMASQDFTKKIANAISEQDSITFDVAEKIAISVQKQSIFTKNYNTDINQNFKGFLRPILEFLYLLEVIKALRDNFFIISRKINDRFFVTKNKRVRLKNLLSPDNFYHKEFIPVYMSLINYDTKKNESNFVKKY